MVKVYDLNMQEIELRGVRWLELTPDSPSVDRDIEKVGNGDIVLGKKLNSRMLQARLMYTAVRFTDYKVLRDELFNLLNPMKDIYIVDTQIPGKRWLVDVDGFSIERINGTVAEVTVSLYSAKATCKSIITTLDPDLEYYDIGPQLEPDMKKYVHTTSTFKVFNAGTETIDPRESELLITIQSTTATSTVLTLTNDTTGDEWTYTGVFDPGDIITINRMKSEKNSANIVGNTNLDLISLEKGQNDFTITGLTGDFEISFEFRYLYV